MIHCMYQHVVLTFPVYVTIYNSSLHSRKKYTLLVWIGCTTYVWIHVITVYTIRSTFRGHTTNTFPCSMRYRRNTEHNNDTIKALHIRTCVHHELLITFQQSYCLNLGKNVYNITFTTDVKLYCVLMHEYISLGS